MLEGRDTLAVMSTGYGKSAIYQIAGVLLERPTVVVSPLLALQSDQVDDLRDHPVGGAAAISSLVADRERRAAIADLSGDRLEFAFLAPEQFARPELLDQLRDARPSLLVVDEAHCISEWGHDFRPDYLRLAAVRKALGHPSVLALTATASQPVRDEIVARLAMADPCVLVRGFDRESLWLGVERFHDARSKRRALLEAVQRAEKPGIVYAATRRSTEELAAELAGGGLGVRAYHGGMGARERDDAQQGFMEGHLEVMVATTAFGMGVDKADVRFVFHQDVADSVDSYYQEVGRAGRDGRPARAVLFYRPEDLGLRRFFAGGGKVGLTEIARVGEAIATAGEAVELEPLQGLTELSAVKLHTAVSRLEEAAAVTVLPGGDVALAVDRAALPEALARAAAAQSDREDFDRSRVEMMRGYAELREDCLREYVLNYFGESYDAPCGNCQNCDAGRVTEERRRPFPIGSRVSHASWGPGLVQRYEGDEMVVLFERVGYKTLDLELVAARGLLKDA